VQRELFPKEDITVFQGQKPSPLALGLYFWPHVENFLESDSEVLFFIDRSGSMRGSSIEQVI